MRPALSEGTVVVASQHQVSTNLSGDAVILGLADSVYYGLKGVGGRIWSLMQEPHALGDIATELCSAYRVEREEALHDLLALSEELIERGLVEVVPAPPR